MFKTLHSKPGAYEGSSGAAGLNLGGESKPEAMGLVGTKETRQVLRLMRQGNLHAQRNIILQGRMCLR